MCRISNAAKRLQYKQLECAPPSSSSGVAETSMPVVRALPRCFAAGEQCCPGQPPHSRMPSSHVGINELLELVVDDQHQGATSSTQHI